jgi:plasmid maintenance system antidote protein VapI
MNRISAVVNGKRSITADTAMRLAGYFGTSPQFVNALTGDVNSPEFGDRNIILV